MKDHRELGRELDLFSFHKEAPGAIFWHPKGWKIFRLLQEFIRKRITEQGYDEISTPVMVKNQLFKRSGHWEHFGHDNMFNLSIYDNEERVEVLKKIKSNEVEKQIKEKIDSGEKHFLLPIEYKNGETIERVEVEFFAHDSAAANKYEYVWNLPVNYSLKPMNCPEACLVYSTRFRSYNDLPIKLAEFGILHRREASGVLGGAMRVRQFMIDDAHLFVRPDQIQEEIHKLLLMVIDFYKSLDFKPAFFLSTKPDKAMGDPGLWEKAENNLKTALDKAEVRYSIKEKDGAFYGPKIDIHIKDSQERDWQVATIQLDFQTPLRMSLSYIDKEAQKQTPVMIHRGIFGSFERFIGILTEHFQGAFPVWLSPVQVAILPVSEKHVQRAQEVATELKNHEVRVEVDGADKTLGAKIRESSLQKVPFMIIIGDKEIGDPELAGAVRTREGKDMGPLKLSEFIKEFKSRIETV